MVSLGPIGRRECTYRCAFCYTNASFPAYPSATPAQVVEWLASCRDEYDIIYVSGDTDSFAPPRTERGIELLAALTSLGKHVLFTTRAVLRPEFLDQVADISDQLRALGRRLIACVSISQLSHPYLEPSPIPSPAARVLQLRELQGRDVATALTIRPFLPNVSPSEYAQIAAMGGPYADVVIGGHWYADVTGELVERVSQAIGRPVVEPPSSAGPLYFSTSDDPNWLTYTHAAAEAATRAVATRLGVPFFMGSEAAVRHILDRVS